ncbi:MAG: hypothetical protein AAGA68_13090 [Pseudomonadota bacterium]
MKSITGLFLLSWVLTQAASMFFLQVGERLAGWTPLRRVAESAHRKKLEALDRTWPLTRVRGAIARRDLRECTLILSGLIMVKSLGALLFGIVTVFWLPLASLFVPSIVAVHDPHDSKLREWIHRVAVRQVTSHALAAALGFALFYVGAIGGAGLSATLDSNLALLAVVLLASGGFAVAAGRLEAGGVLERGI